VRRTLLYDLTTFEQHVSRVTLEIYKVALFIDGDRQNFAWRLTKWLVHRCPHTSPLPEAG
jgi:hypothetical protein